MSAFELFKLIVVWGADGNTYHDVCEGGGWWGNEQREIFVKYNVNIIKCIDRFNFLPLMVCIPVISINDAHMWASVSLA